MLPRRQVSERVLGELKEAVEVLKKGGIVAYPTESFYGLGADPFNPVAVERIFEIKGRDKGKPILLIIPLREKAEELVLEITPLAKLLMERFWPGPLTIVFKAGRLIDVSLHAGTGKIGLRLSPHPVALYLSNALGAITGTSANISNSPPMTHKKDVEKALGNMVDLVLDWEVPGIGVPSTVVDASEEKLQIIREGQITKEEIFRVAELI